MRELLPTVTLIDGQEAVLVEDLELVRQELRASLAAKVRALRMPAVFASGPAEMAGAWLAGKEAAHAALREGSDPASPEAAPLTGEGQ